MLTSAIAGTLTRTKLIAYGTHFDGAQWERLAGKVMACVDVDSQGRLSY